MEPNKESGKNPMTMIVVVIAVIVAIGGGIYILNSQQSMSTTNTMEESITEMESEEQEADAMESTEVKTFTLEGGSFYYEPNIIRVKKGDTVKVVLNSVDMQHDFVIDEFNTQTPVIKSGETGEVTFVASEAGEFEFYCSVGSHRQNGMVGTLIVEE